MIKVILYSCVFIIGFTCGIFYSTIYVKEIPPTNNDAVSKRLSEIAALSQRKNKDTVLTDTTPQNNVSNNTSNKSSNETLNKTQKKFTNYELFVSYLNTSELQKALDIYQSDVTNDTIAMYQNYLFEFIEKKIEQRDSSSIELLNKFIQIEFNNTYALYLRSQIYFQEEQYKKAITELIELKAFYLESEFESKVNAKIDNYSTYFIQTLQEKKSDKELIKFLHFLLNHNPNNTKYSYTLAQTYFNLYNYDKAKTILEELMYDETYKNSVEKLLSVINKKIELSQKFSKKIKLEKQGTHFLIKAILNEEIEVKLLLDTGATTTIIDNTIIDRINHTTVDENIQLNTAGGFVKAKEVQINTFSISDTTVKNMKLISTKMYDDSFDGLLGMSFFKHYDFYIDQVNSILHLNPK